MTARDRREREDVPRAAHVPVLAREVVDAFRATLAARRSTSPHGDWIVDATLGLGGHAELLLEALPDVQILGVDQDENAIEVARPRLERFARRVRLRRARMTELATLLRDEDVGHVAGFLMDLGVSSMQLDRAQRGFSFQADGPLDMRMDRTRE